jgi:fatty acid desaturase
MDKATWITLRARLPVQVIAWPTLLMLCADIGLLSVSLQLFKDSWYWYPLAWLMEAIALLQIYLIHHEAVHGSVFRRLRHNALLGHVLGAAILYPYLPRRDSHLAHHRWTGHPEGDPTNRRLVARLSALSAKGEASIEALWRTWLPFIALMERVALWRVSFANGREERTFFGRNQQRVASSLTSSAWILLLCALGWHGMLLQYLFWYVPGLLLLFALEELVNLPHHAEAPLVDSMKPMEFWRQDEVTHSCRRLPLWSSCILMNFNLHTAHHYYPSVAWYRLPLVDRLAEGKMATALMPVENELRWSLRHRKGSFLALFGSYRAIAHHE